MPPIWVLVPFVIAGAGGGLALATSVAIDFTLRNLAASGSVPADTPLFSPAPYAGLTNAFRPRFVGLTPGIDRMIRFLRRLIWLCVGSISVFLVAASMWAITSSTPGTIVVPAFLAIQYAAQMGGIALQARIGVLADTGRLPSGKSPQVFTGWGVLRAFRRDIGMVEDQWVMRLLLVVRAATIASGLVVAAIVIFIISAVQGRS